MNRTAMVFAGLGFELLGVMLAGAFFGGAVDKYMGWSGVGFLAVSGTLFAGWVVHFIYLIQRYVAETERSDKE